MSPITNVTTPAEQNAQHTLRHFVTLFSVAGQVGCCSRGQENKMFNSIMMDYLNFVKVSYVCALFGNIRAAEQASNNKFS